MLAFLLFFWMMAKLNFLLYTRAYYKLRFPLSLGLLLSPDSSFSSFLAVLFVSRYGSHLFPPVSSPACIIRVSAYNRVSSCIHIYLFCSLSTTSCLSSSLSLSFSLSNMDFTRISYPPFHFPSPLPFITAYVFFCFCFFPSNPFLRLFFVCLSSVKNTPRLCSSIIPFTSNQENLDRLPPAPTLDTKSMPLSSPSFQCDCVVCRASYQLSRPSVCSDLYSYLLTFCYFRFVMCLLLSVCGLIIDLGQLQAIITLDELALRNFVCDRFATL